jgi:succinate-semialdehyde dehydrogenase/glutarate-semialdehyde dehydrogenase
MVLVERSEKQSAKTYNRIDVLNPVTQEIIGQIPCSTKEEVIAAVERARFAQKTWGALTVKERTKFIRRWLDLLWKRQEDGIKVLRAENGKAKGSALLEFLAIDGIGQYFIHHAPHILKPKRRPTIFPTIHWAKIHYKPHGVVGIISPWNYPFALPFMDMIPALIAGNTVILKPSEITPFIAQWAVDLMYEIGIPRDVVQALQGDGRTGAALLDYVDYIQFTGSTAVGREVGRHAAERLIPFSLELGGNDPSIVLDDADIDMAAIGLIQGAFENAGQMCISIERVYVEAAIYDRLLEKLQHYAKDITINAEDGMKTVVGSMTNASELRRTQAHIDDAVQKGAKIIVGGNPRPDLGKFFFEPTILVDVDHTMDIMREETFGPLMPIMKVKNEQEALELANDTQYGLSASIFSGNHKRAKNLALQIDTGDVAINRAQFVVGTASLPSGGQRSSGLGRRNGSEGLLKYTVSQSILVDNLLLGAEKELIIATPFVRTMINLLRAIRRYIPFI